MAIVKVDCAMGRKIIGTLKRPHILRSTFSMRKKRTPFVLAPANGSWSHFFEMLEGFDTNKAFERDQPQSNSDDRELFETN